MAIFYAPLFFRIALAMPWIGPMPTPVGLMAIAGVSPRPTEAPGLNGIPQELLRRQDVQYPPPANWCGFVNGIYDDPLSCSVGLTCVNSGQALGCCTATTGICTALFTTCLNYQDECGQLCQQDSAIRKCDALKPFCGTYAFPGDTSLFDCMVTSMLIQDVEFLNDFYITAIGSTLASDATINPFGFTASASLDPYAATPTDSDTDSGSVTGSTSQSSSALYSGSSPASGSSSSSDTIYNPPHSGLPQGAIDGIAAGVTIIGALILGLAAFCCVRTRRRKRVAAASRPPTYFPPPMQQQAQPPPPKVFDGYHSVSQQEQQYTQYPGPHQQAQPYFPPPISAVSPQSDGAIDPRFSIANTSLLSSRPSDPEQRQSYYKTPLLPMATEVDGTTGNPGIPTDVMHGVPTEVDGTMGNPGIPAGGHGIEHQMMPGGSPSAVEMDGRIGRQAPLRKPVGNSQQGSMGTSMGQPYTEGPYELGYDGH
ncbi:MAG: hypothetical protein ALECFALPRED_006112 [Alectoria fallacina]|uniref:Uncharacterized protein n=1 Tax=Alectoria fallacina TaxID=1903189 RepID=A0A8H3EQT4_9LECA|nr:MAG: hypothetical protein ALECFALPRED_006112 [Alectoria fallacina]